MKGLVLILLTVAWSATALMNLNTFKKNIKPICYNKTDDLMLELVAGQQVPMSNSIETFLTLLEKLEASGRFSSATDLLEHILTGYRIDDLHYTPPAGYSSSGTFRTSSKLHNAQKLMKNLLNVNENAGNVEEILTDSEKCSMFYMLSHTVNDTSKKGELSQAASSYSNVRSTGKITYSQTLNPREQGVVSIKGNEIHALALGRVLTGIYVALKKPGTDTLQAVYDRVKTSRSEASALITGNAQFDYVYGSTIAELITLILVEEIQKTADALEVKFGGNGNWNSSLCTTEYKLDSIFEGYATYSMFRGAADGLFLGVESQQWINSRNLKLSKLLRMYYSSRGVPGTSSPSLSYCSRSSFMKSKKDDISKQAANYCSLYSAVYSDLYDNSDDVTKYTEKVLTTFYNSFSDIFDKIFENDDCDESTSNIMCETPSDVFFVLDSRSTVRDNFNVEQEVVSKVVNKMDLRPDGSSISVYANVRRRTRTEGDDMYDVVVNSTSGGCPGCKTAWFTAAGMSSMDDTSAIESINNLLKSFEEDRAEKPGVPGKFVVYFNYGSPRDDSQLLAAIRDLHLSHRDVPIIAVGSNKKELEKFVRDKDKDVITGSSDSSYILQILMNRICESPATLQYSECASRSQSLEAENKFEGYVTPNRVQYWAMYPEYFLKSFTIKISFSCEGGDIKVCHSRYQSDVKDRSKATCMDVVSEGSPAEFIIKNPCRKRDVNNCNPFFFAIIGKESSGGGGGGNTQASCTDDGCKYTDQIRFTVSHTGVSCSGAGSLVTSFLLIPLLVFLSFHSRP